MAKAAGKSVPQPAHAALARMTTAQATVEALLAHGIARIYALPGVHNDHLLDALAKAGDRIHTLHPRHEAGAAYMALGAALATGRPQAYAVVPGPGLLNSSAALLTAYGMNAPVLALIGQIPQAAIGRGLGHLHEIRDQGGILARLVDFSARITAPHEAAPLVASAIRSMFTGRPGPAALECAIDVWGRSAPLAPIAPPEPPTQAPIDEDAVRDAAKRLGAARNPLIVCGGGAQDAAEEVTRLSAMLQAPVLAFRRGRGVLDSRDPLSVTLPLGHELWAEADVVLAVGTRLFMQYTAWGVDDELAIIRVDADPEEPERVQPPAVALIGDAKPILRRLADVLPAHKLSCARGWPSSHRSLPFSRRFARSCLRKASSSMRSRRWALWRGLRCPSTGRAPSFRPATRTTSAGALPPRSACRMPGARCRCSPSPATAASFTPPTSWPPPCATASRSLAWCSPTARSATCAASSRSATATA